MISMLHPLNTISRRLCSPDSGIGRRNLGYWFDFEHLAVVFHTVDSIGCRIGSQGLRQSFDSVKSVGDYLNSVAAQFVVWHLQAFGFDYRQCQRLE